MSLPLTDCQQLIVNTLTHHEASTHGQLEQHLGTPLPRATFSRDIAPLLIAGLITRQGRGKEITYQISSTTPVTSISASPPPITANIVSSVKAQDSSQPIVDTPTPSPVKPSLISKIPGWSKSVSIGTDQDKVVATASVTNPLVAPSKILKQIFSREGIKINITPLNPFQNS